MKRFERGFTIIELMMATLLTLMLMLIVVGLFAAVSEGIRNSRATMEMAGRLRATKRKLQLDLEGRTVIVSPPARPAAGEGYLEIIEGPLGPAPVPDPKPVNFDEPDPIDPTQPAVDTTVADFDDILMLTTRSRAGPFVGRYGGGTIQSYETEVAWFVRGRTLYRRVLLIAPQVMPDLDTDANGVVDLVDTANESFYALYDISARLEYDISGAMWGWVPNTLGDLTKRENRFAHRLNASSYVFPFDAGRWGQLGLPILCECSHPSWMDPAALPPQVTPVNQIDLWNNPHPWVDASNLPQVDRTTGAHLAFYNPGSPAPGQRIAEDVILTNVIGFDIKVWDPEAPVFWAVNDNHTPADLRDDTSISGLVVRPGDAGYPLAQARWVHELVTNPGNAQNTSFAPRQRGAYVDLGYAEYPALVYHGSDTNGDGVNDTVDPRYNQIYNLMSTFPGPGNASSGLVRVYDTWSFHYEHDGVNQDGDTDASGAPLIDEGTDGFDNDGDGVVDDGPNVDLNGDGVFSGPAELGEMEAIAPYPVPLRGIQIKIRTFEPDSRQVREVTVVADFSLK
ncbi:MAG: hypothetical protein ABIP48_00310 [Planctomycetota bacterium]